MKKGVIGVLLPLLLIGCTLTWYPMTHWSIEGSYTKEGETMFITAPTTLTFQESLKGIDFDDFHWRGKLKCDTLAAVLVSFPPSFQHSSGRKYLIVAAETTDEQFDTLNQFEAERISVPTEKWATVGITISHSSIRVSVESKHQTEDDVYPLQITEVTTSTKQATDDLFRINVLQGQCHFEALEIKN